MPSRDQTPSGEERVWLREDRSSGLMVQTFAPDKWERTREFIPADTPSPRERALANEGHALVRSLLTAFPAAMPRSVKQATDRFVEALNEGAA